MGCVNAPAAHSLPIDSKAWDRLSLPLSKLQLPIAINHHAKGVVRLPCKVAWFCPIGGKYMLLGASSSSPLGLIHSSTSGAASSVSLSPSSSSASVVDDGDAAADAMGHRLQLARLAQQYQEVGDRYELCIARLAEAADTMGHRLQLGRLALQYQEVADRYELCIARLAEAAEEAAALRRENAELRVANSDLTRRLALLIGKHTAAAVAAEIHRLCLGEQKAAAATRERAPEKLAVLPKSISVRSNSHLKMNQAHPPRRRSTTASSTRRTPP
ncbi:hypothetical protein ACP70R_001470 [Stipagrostis hirtigluma subsp. patula]